MTTLKEHRHKAKGEPKIRAFLGAVRQPENRAAHGGVCYVDSCRCGATRTTNVNAPHVERGPWIEPCAVCQSEPGTVGALWDDADVLVCRSCYAHETGTEDEAGRVVVSVRETMDPRERLHPGNIVEHCGGLWRVLAVDANPAAAVHLVSTDPSTPDLDVFALPSAVTLVSRW